MIKVTFTIPLKNIGEVGEKLELFQKCTVFIILVRGRPEMTPALDENSENVLF